MLSAATRKELLINVGAAEFRAAIVENGRLHDLVSESLVGTGESSSAQCRSRHVSRIGDIISGRVRKVMPATQAAFVDIGLERAGFLGVREARYLAPSQINHDEPLPAIGDCVREGEEVLVQIVKDPMGDKGARLTAGVTLPGRLLVLVPCRPGVAVSHRIQDERERARLTDLCGAVLADPENALPSGAGLIVRSAAAGADYAELRADCERLTEVWQGILDGRRGAKVPPVTLHRDLAPIERTLREELDTQTSRALIDDRETFEAARAYCRRTMPEAEGNLELFSGPGALFDTYGIEDDIAQLFESRIRLPSGGWITIEGTEALTAIDVNSGSFTDAADLEQTAFQVNREAAGEIGRQLRLRGIGGVVVVDFIRMTAPENHQQVLDALSAGLARDRTLSQISAVSGFGLVAITRKRVRDALAKRMTEFCHSCEGRGRIRTRERVALEVLRQIERAAAAAPDKPVLIRAAPDVVSWLTAHEAEIRTRLARRSASRVVFEARKEFQREDFDVTTQP